MQNSCAADGLSIPALLEGIIPLFELDSYDDPLVMMAAVEGDALDPSVEESYMAAIKKEASDAPAVREMRSGFEYQQMLLDEFNAALPEKPHWK